MPEENIELVPEKQKKPFLGGYRNKLTGQVYHHAKVQTLPPPWKYPVIERFNRSTQTAEMVDGEQQTAHHAFTQVEVPNIYIPKDKDKIIFATGVYESADSIAKKRHEAIITIQKYFRGWTARKLCKAMKEELLNRILWEDEQLRLRKLEEIKWLNELEYRKKYPNTKDDFTLLFSEIQKWWVEQSQTLKTTKTGAELKVCLYTLLNQEAEKIKEITGKRLDVTVSEALDRRHKLLSKASAPKIWKAYKGPIPVENSWTQQARVLRDLYTTLCKPKLVPEDRMAALKQLREIMTHYKCTLTSNIMSLADREVDLLKRRTAENHLAGLRLRIRNLVWQFLRQPAFNPEMQNLLRLRKVDNKAPLILLCSSCSEYYILPTDSIDEAANCSVLKQRSTKCKKCRYLQNEGWLRKDLEIYKRMLQILITEEEKKMMMSGIVHLLQPHDISYLVERIWKCQSCLSGLTVLKDLELVRWNTLRNWTPWNCLLVTREEAALHNRLEDFKKMYDKEFCQSVHLKHIEARNYFSTIPRFLPYLLSSNDQDYYSDYCFDSQYNNDDSNRMIENF